MKFTLGNYVYLFAWQGEPPNSVKVETSLGLSDLYGVLSGAMTFEPIPLTEEWLLKFGFKKKSKGFYIKNELIRNTKWSYQIEIFPSVPNLSYCAIYEGGEGVVIRNFQHVHQLQNLYFALTGEELTIK